MSTTREHNPEIHLAPTLVSVLRQLRRAIRAYVWVEGLALALVALGLSFWFSLGFDWLFEPPAALRVALLVAATLALVWVLFRYIFRRAFVSLADRSMALLLERRFDRFHDSLLTTVELAEFRDHAGDFNPEMLVHTQDAALAEAHDLRLRNVFNLRPLARGLALAVLLVASVVAFGVAASDAFAIWARRSLFLSDELWPRKTALTVEGFVDGRRKLARGSDLDLVVKAAVGPERVVPEVVEVRYVLGGARGRENMSRSGNAVLGQDDFQQFNYTFKGVLAPIEFYVRGGDDRQGPFHLDVVDSPTVGQMVLHCEYPAYMQRAPRDIPVTGAMPLPRGTRVTIQALANKDIVQVQIDDLVDEQTPVTHKLEMTGAADPRRFSYVIDALESDKTLRFTLLDVDGIRSREPVRLSLSSVADESPQVNVQLRGIGTAITPNAHLPWGGEITDDNGLAKAWSSFHADENEPSEQPFRAAPDGHDKLVVDETLEVEPLKLVPKQKFHVMVEATDTYNLGDAPNRGTSQRYALDVVTPEQLRSMLEARELLLRRRFETIIGEMTENRDALARMDFGLPPAADKAAAADDGPEAQVINPADEPGDEPGDAARAPDAAESQGGAERRMSLRRVHAERALQNGQRSADETLGLAASFDAIRDELINNRVDTEELKTRLKEGIADPLRRIGTDMFPELERRLRLLQARLADPQAGAAAQTAALQQADAILVEMNLVLGKMVELETFNEVLDLLRGIIESQQNINDRTKIKQKEKLKNLREDE